MRQIPERFARKHYLSFGLAAICAAVTLSGAARATDDSGKSFFWKVTAADGSYVYLLGSVHVANKGMYPLPKAIEDAFAESTNLVVEADVDNPATQMTVQQDMLTKGMYGAGDSLDKHLSEKSMKTFKDFAATTGMPAEQLVQMKPWVLAMLITMTEMQKQGFDPELGIDKHFLAGAKEKNKKVLELESVEFQINLLSGFNDDMQEKFLISTLGDVANLKTDVDKMIDAWKRGDTAAMETFLFKQLKEKPEFQPVFDKVLFDRNVGMVEKIEGYLKAKDKNFVVMGAGHLVGDKGILKALQTKNYKVEQVNTGK